MIPITHLKRTVVKFLLKGFYRKIKIKAALALFVVFCLAITAVGFLFMAAFENSMRQTIIDNHKTIVIRSAEEIYQLLKRHEETFAATAAVIGALGSDPWHQETILVELALKHPVFKQVSSFDRYLKRVATSDLGVQSEEENIPYMAHRIFSGHEHVSFMRFRDNQVPYISMVVPLKKGSAVTGLLCADIDIRELWRTTDNIHIGSTGYAVVISDDGTVIAHQDKKIVFKKEKFLGYKDARIALDRKTRSQEWKDRSGELWISSYAPIKDTQWGIILRQRVSEAFLPVRVVKTQILIIVALSLMMAAWLSIVIGAALTRPLQALAARTRSIIDGHADDGSRFKRQDEIGQLVRIFDNLAGRLKKEQDRETFSDIREATAWVAHELKNSLFSIKSFLKFFPEKHDEQGYLVKYNSLIPAEISRLERMLKGLAEFSSSAELKKINLDLKELIKEVARITEDGLKDKNISLEFSSCREPLFVSGDPDKLKQVFLNLILNAFDAIVSSGKILVTAEKENDCSIRIEVADTGAGIPPERVQGIFEPFKSTKKEGFGLGLAISRTIIRKLGGDITVRASRQGGAVFSILLPQAPVETPHGKTEERLKGY